MQQGEKFSFPKNKIRVLLLEGIHKAAGEAFRADGYEGELAGGGFLGLGAVLVCSPLVLTKSGSGGVQGHLLKGGAD